DSRCGVGRRDFPGRAERPLPLRRARGRAVRLVGRRGRSRPRGPVPDSTVAAAHDGPRAPKRDGHVTPRCLIVHPGALGDVLLAGPALAHLRSVGFQTTLAVTSRLVALFASSGLVDEARDLETLALHRLFVEPPAPGALAPVDGFDAVVCWLGAGDPAFGRNL